MTPFQNALLVATLVALDVGSTATGHVRDAGSNRIAAANALLIGYPNKEFCSGLAAHRMGFEPDTVRAGETFITNLPDSLGGRSVSSYRGAALPSMSWLYRRSFFWRTTVGDRGDHEFWFRAELEDGGTDSTAVRVTVE